MAFGRDQTDRRFAHFCRTGDPDALGDVFDRTAGRLMRVALWLVRDRADAEDLLQRTFLQAIETRQQFRPGEAVLPWLMGLLGNQARKLHRERNRAAALRPQQDRVADPEVDAATGELEAAVRMVRDRLGEPYRQVLQLHLEQGLNAKEIAERLGRPGGTVRTQLMRALDLLRRRLPKGFVAGFAAVAVIESSALAGVRSAVLAVARHAAPVPMGAGTATMAIGGILVAKKTGLVLCSMALLLCAGGAWWVRQTQGAEPPSVAAAAAAAPTRTAVAEEPDAVAGAVRPAVPADLAPARREYVPPVPALGPLATLCGRCVDEQGAGIAGLTAELLGWEGNDQRMNAWLADHPRLENLEQKASTATDGTFRFRFWPPPPFGFRLRIHGEGRATWEERWDELKPGATVDLGDLKLPAGTLLRGRVVDTDGQPVARPQVRFKLATPSALPQRLTDWDIGQGKEDGTFRTRWPLAAGDYQVEVPRREIEQPHQVKLTGEREQVIEIVLRKIVAADSLQGAVVDDDGKPVPYAQLCAMSSPGERVPVAYTDLDGRFCLTRSQQTADQPQLRLTCTGFEYLTTEHFAWGRTDLRLVMHRGIALEVAVVTSPDARPVEDFQLFVFPSAGDAAGSDPLVFRARSYGRHEGGRASVTGLRRARYEVLVVPDDETLAMSPFMPVEIADPGPVRLTLSLPAKLRRPVRVQRADGTPIEGATVLLVDPLGIAADEPAKALASSQWGTVNGSKMLIVGKATTDALGQADLQGPGGRAFSVQLPGPGYVPRTVTDVSLDLAEPLLVTVSTGGRLRGTIGPAEVRAEFRRLAEVKEGQPDEMGRSRPTVQLRRTTGTRREVFPDGRGGVRSGEDGTWTMDGIPPGTWNVDVTCIHAMSEEGRMSCAEPAGTVTVRDGETTELPIDLSAMVPGTLDGTVLRNGAPLARGTVTLSAGVTMQMTWDAQGRFIAAMQATTDDQGRFHATMPPGDYALGIQGDAGRPGLRARERAFVVRGQSTSQTFQIVSARLRLRVLDAQGQPVPGVIISLRDAQTERWSLPPTDADGRTEQDVEADTWTAFVLPKHLQTPEAQQEVSRSHPGNPDPFASFRILLGDVTAGASGRPIELRLPPEWGR